MLEDERAILRPDAEGHVDLDDALARVNVHSQEKIIELRAVAAAHDEDDARSLIEATKKVAIRVGERRLELGHVVHHDLVHRAVGFGDQREILFFFRVTRASVEKRGADDQADDDPETRSAHSAPMGITAGCKTPLSVGAAVAPGGSGFK